MKYFRIFKAKKPIGQLSEAERREFANNMASNILENIISVETCSKAQDLKDVVPSNFVNTRDDFIRICKARDDLKKIEKETVDKAFEMHSQEYLRYLNSVRVISSSNLVEVSLEYLTLNWIDAAIHKRSLDLYNRLIEIKSSLIKSDLWSGELDSIYRYTSFGQSGSKPSSFVNCSVVIKQKDKARLFNSTWDRDFGPALSSEAYKESTDLGSAKIWSAIANGMLPDLKLAFREFSGWLK
jgi:hypothetical protein